MPAAKAAERYARVCQHFGRRRLAGLEESDRLAELLEAVAAAADPAGVPLFAGWRAMPLPDDAPARAMQLALGEAGGAELTALLTAAHEAVRALVD